LDRPAADDGGPQRRAAGRDSGPPGRVRRLGRRCRRPQHRRTPPSAADLVRRGRLSLHHPCATPPMSFNRRRSYQPTRPRTKIEEPIQTVNPRDGTTIAYDRYGQGPPLIMVMRAFNRSTPAHATVDPSSGTEASTASTSWPDGVAPSAKSLELTRPRMP